MRIYLADLGHNYITATADVYPLGVANLAAYASANVQSPDQLEFTIFREPEELKAAIDAEVPDILGLSSYSWNHRLALAFAQYLKAKSPRAFTLMGGPNFPLTRDEQESWMRTMPEIDAHVRGPTYEGEIAFSSLIQRFSDVGGNIEGLFESPVPGNQWIDPSSGDFVMGGELERIRDLDEIPSPYLNGSLDKFFKTGYLAHMQIARGCPFTCQFCNSAPRSNSKAFRHSFENIKADLDYVVARISPDAALSFADDNFGMYQQDEEIADYLGHLMDKHDWPKYIRTTTGKNKSDRIIRVMRKAKGRLPMTSAVQSLNPAVLKNIRRQNIKLETYSDVQKALHELGMQSYGELILCMPGESKASFMDAVDQLIETGVSRVSAHQLMLLHGAPLCDPDQRERFQFKTKFRIVARCIGDYTDEMVIETEEMVVETPDFSFADYIDTRVFHLLLTIYYYEDNFEEGFKLAREFGVRPFKVIERMQALLADAPPAFQQTIDDYIQENKDELYDTREACVIASKAHVDKLLSGELGGNLLSKYSMIGRFFVLPETLEFLEAVLLSLCEDEGVVDQRQEMVRCVSEYFRNVMLHAPFAASLEMAPEWQSTYNVEAWRRNDFVEPLSTFKQAPAVQMRAQIDDRMKSLISSRLQTFGEHPQGMGRFTRTMFAKDMRRLVGEDVTKLH